MTFIYRLLSILLILVFAPLAAILGLRETGRLLIARICGVRVFEFVFGFGKEIWQTNYGETKYSLRLIPLGSYLNMDSRPETRFQELAFWRKCAITLAGPTSLLVAALSLMLFMQIYFGQNEASSAPIIGSVVPELPAALAGLKAGDRIVTINEIKVTDWKTLVDRIAEYGEAEFTLQVERDTEVHQVRLTPRYFDVSGKLAIGIAPQVERVRPSLRMALSNSITAIAAVATSLNNLLKQKGDPEIVIFSGPVPELNSGVFKFALYQLFVGIALLFFLALLPVPFFCDGGHFLFYCFEAIKGSPAPINYPFWANRLGLAVVPLFMGLSVVAGI